MRLTQHTDFALRVLIYLALIEGRRATIEEISLAYDISKNHLMKVVQKLARMGYIQSSRGAKGGIALHLDPQQITIGEVVASLEPDFALVECYRPDNQCVITPSCRLPRMLNEATRAFKQVLDRYTVADLVTPERRGELKMLLRLA